MNNYRNENKKSIRGRESLYTKNKINQTTQRKKITRVKRLTEKVSSNLWNLKMTTHTHTDTLSRRFKEIKKNQNKSSKKRNIRTKKVKNKKELVQ